jgi:hypothetical protein
MIRLFIILLLLLGCLPYGVFGYLMYKIWMDQKRIIGNGVIRNRNVSARCERSKKKKACRIK